MPRRHCPFTEIDIKRLVLVTAAGLKVYGVKRHSEELAELYVSMR